MSLQTMVLQRVVGPITSVLILIVAYQMTPATMWTTSEVSSILDSDLAKTPSMADMVNNMGYAGQTALTLVGQVHDDGLLVSIAYQIIAVVEVVHLSVAYWKAEIVWALIVVMHTVDNVIFLAARLLSPDVKELAHMVVCVLLQIAGVIAMGSSFILCQVVGVLMRRRKQSSALMLFSLVALYHTHSMETVLSWMGVSWTAMRWAERVVRLFY